ncbi:MAG: hypothetical protein JRE40_15960 [Deltaproteobacteria bacterium]|nr:hypothetical protein [Deltaproteobacteria bacterium]MBW2674622.1 hypothetical protein [Deltaproteobacteria bacterium]
MTYDTLIKVLRSEAQSWRKYGGGNPFSTEITLHIAAAFEDLADALEEVEDE